MNERRDSDSVPRPGAHVVEHRSAIPPPAKSNGSADTDAEEITRPDSPMPFFECIRAIEQELRGLRASTEEMRSFQSRIDVRLAEGEQRFDRIEGALRTVAHEATRANAALSNLDVTRHQLDELRAVCKLQHGR